MAITNFDGIIAARAGGFGEDLVFSKAGTSAAVGSWVSYHRVGPTPSSFAPSNIPGGAVMTATSTAAMPLRTPAASTKSKYLLTAGQTVGVANAPAAILYCDILVAAANISVATSSTQTINTVALTRCTDGIGVQMVFVVNTAIGATASSAIVEWTASDDTTQSSTFVVTTASPVWRCLPFINGGWPWLPHGKAGVKSVQSIKFTAANTGGMDLLLVKPLCIVPSVAVNTYVERDTTIQIDGLIQVPQDSSGTPGFIGMFGMLGAANAANISGLLRFCEG